MKKILTILMLLTFTCVSYASCIDKYKSTKVRHYQDKMEESSADALNLVSGFGSIALGVGYIGFTFMGGMAVLAIASAPIMVGEAIKGIKNRKENRAIRLIKQSYDYLETGKARRFLRRIVRKMKKVNPEASIEEVAQAIVYGNENMSLCKGDAGVAEIKKAKFENRIIYID
jgi:hypothetical protein